jgi:hypothetical protein
MTTISAEEYFYRKEEDKRDLKQFQAESDENLYLSFTKKPVDSLSEDDEDDEQVKEYPPILSKDSLKTNIPF